MLFCEHEQNTCYFQKEKEKQIFGKRSNQCIWQLQYNTISDNKLGWSCWGITPTKNGMLMFWNSQLQDRNTSGLHL